MDYTWVILGTLLGFLFLAALLLVPIYLFLKKEEQESEKWTDRPPTDGRKDT